MHSRIVFMLAFLFISECLPALEQAEQQADEKPDEATERENPVSRIPYETGEKSQVTCESRWSDFLPIWGKEACERGYVLPRPFGVSLNYMHQDQAFDVGNIYINGIDAKTPGVAVVDEVQNDASTVTLRFDAWIMPFWNIYGILSRTRGETTGPLSLDLEPLFPEICARPGNDCSTHIDLVVHTVGDVVGYGTTVAGGYKDFFGMIDYNRTRADIDIFSTDAIAKVASARIGWNGQLGGFTGVLWVGVMHQNIANTLELPVDIGEDVLEVAIEQSVQNPWNLVVGGQWDINRSFSILAEFGLGQRQSQMLNLNVRF